MGERMDDIQSRIIELVAKSKNLPVSDVRMDSTFEELQIDSLDKINLSFEVEEIFSIEIPDDALNSLKTVGDVVRSVRSRNRAPISAPISEHIVSNEIFSSWPLCALVDGVKIGAGKRSLSRSPAGSGMPQTVPCALYSFQPEPAR